MGQAHTHSARDVVFDKEAELLVYPWNSVIQQLRFNFSETELLINLKAGNQRKEGKRCTGQQNYLGKQFTWLFSSRRGNKPSVEQFQHCSGAKALKERTSWLSKETMDIHYSFGQCVFFIFSLFYSKFSM